MESLYSDGMRGNMKKVLFLANSSSGLYDFRNELVLELLKKYEVYISVPDERAVDKLEAEGCKMIHTEINRRGVNPVQDIKLFFHYYKLLGQIKPDVILTYTIKPNIYGGFAARLRNIPYLVNITGIGSAFARDNMLQKMVVLMYRQVMKKASCIFFQNDGNKQVFEKHRILGQKSRRINGSGVNLETHPYEPYPRREKPHFLLASRLMRDKGIEEYLAGAKKYAKYAQFDIIGYCEEDHEEEILRLQSEGILKFHGYQTNVNAFYKDIDAVIVTSHQEGMSNVILESAATGRPALATNIDGCKEAVEDNKTGILFEQKSNEALYEAIEKFLALSVEEREEMGRRARAKVEREFNRADVVKAYMEEIQNVAG